MNTSTHNLEQDLERGARRDSDRTVLDIRDLSVSFKGRRREPEFKALDGVSMTIRSGRTMGLIGESGSGKSTLANAVLGLAPVRSGTITLLDRDVTHLGARARRQLAQTLQVVFQDPNSALDPSWTVGRSLAEPLRLQGRRDTAAIRERTAQLLDDIGLDRAAAGRYPAQFSGGQRQRICIARALMTSPEIIICDESVSALDLSVQAQILNLLSDLQAKHGLSYLFISHNMAVVRHVCHDVTVLYRGQVMEAGPTNLVTNTPAHPYTRALLLAVPVADPQTQRARASMAAQSATNVPSAPGASSNVEDASACAFVNRCPVAVPKCSTERPELRETGDGRFVACHRYPEWQHEVPAVSGPGGPLPVTAQASAAETTNDVTPPPVTGTAGSRGPAADPTLGKEDPR